MVICGLDEPSFLATLVKSDFVPKYHFKVSPLLTLVIENLRLSPEQKEYLKKIDTECRAGMEMINNSLLRKKL